jgi:hypothetical protein
MLPGERATPNSNHIPDGTTIAMVLLSTVAMAMGQGEAMKASPEPAAHAPAVTTPHHPSHPAVVHKHKKHG